MALSFRRMADPSTDNHPPSRHDSPKEMAVDSRATTSDILEPIKAVEKQGNLNEVKPGGPSWNDPPVVKFYDGSAKTSSGNLKHIKRIEKTGAETDSNISEPLLVTLNDDEKSGSNLTDQIPDSEKKNFVVATFKDILSQPTSDEQRNIKDIEKRLHVLEESWDKLSSDVKQNMYKLAYELTGDHIENALKIQCHLMVHHVREVKNWMVAVKHLISMKKELLNCENENMTSTENSS